MGFSPLFLGGSGACKSNMADKTSYRSYFPSTAARFVQKKSPHQTVFKLTLSQKSIYVFRKDRLCKFIFLLSPSLDLINIISVRALEAMKVAGETLQGSRRSWPAAGCRLLSTTPGRSSNDVGPVPGISNDDRTFYPF